MRPYSPVGQSCQSLTALSRWFVHSFILTRRSEEHPRFPLVRWMCHVGSAPSSPRCGWSSNYHVNDYSHTVKLNPFSDPLPPVSPSLGCSGPLCGLGLFKSRVSRGTDAVCIASPLGDREEDFSLLVIETAVFPFRLSFHSSQFKTFNKRPLARRGRSVSEPCREFAIPTDSQGSIPIDPLLSADRSLKRPYYLL